jgi:hypothetical protein
LEARLQIELVEFQRLARRLQSDAAGQRALDQDEPGLAGREGGAEALARAIRMPPADPLERRKCMTASLWISRCFR